MFRDKPIDSHIQFIKEFQEYLIQSTIFITLQWYPKIVGVLKKHLKQRSIPKKQIRKTFECAAGLINRQLNETKMKTIDEIINAISDKGSIPLIPIDSCCKPILVFTPDIKGLYNCYEKLINSILNIGSNLDPLLFKFGNDMIEQYNPIRWKIEIGPIYPQEVKVRLWKAITVSYISVSNFFNMMEEKFSILYGAKEIEEFEAFLVSNPTFEECLNRIKCFTAAIENVKSLIDNEFFDVSTVSVQVAKQDLRICGDILLNKAIERIFQTHLNDNINICKEFEYIKYRALKIPLSTEELLESGDYILYAKNQYIPILLEKIQNSLEVNNNF